MMLSASSCTNVSASKPSFLPVASWPRAAAPRPASCRCVEKCPRRGRNVLLPGMPPRSGEIHDALGLVDPERPRVKKASRGVVRYPVGVAASGVQHCAALLLVRFSASRDELVLELERAQLVILTQGGDGFVHRIFPSSGNFHLVPKLLLGNPIFFAKLLLCLEISDSSHCSALSLPKQSLGETRAFPRGALEREQRAHGPPYG